MRYLSAAVKTAIAEEISTVFLFQLETPGTVMRLTSASYDINIPSIGVFFANNTLDKVEAPRLSEVVDREAYKVSFIDIDGNMREIFEQGITGSVLTVWVCFLNTTDSTLNGVTPGGYLTAIDDLVIAYKGTVDTHGITIDPSNGVVSAVVEGASPVAALGMTRAITTTKEYIKQIVSTDTSFDQVFEEGARLPWGKIS